MTVILDNGSEEQRHEWRIDLDDETLTAANPGLDATQGFRLLTTLRPPSSPRSPPTRTRTAGWQLSPRSRRGSWRPRPREATMRPSFADGLRVQRLMAEIESSQAVTR